MSATVLSIFPLQRHCISQSALCQIDTLNLFAIISNMKRKKPNKAAKQITVRDVPEDMYWWLWEMAQAKRRPMNDQIVAILKRVKDQAENFNADLL